MLRKPADRRQSSGTLKTVSLAVEVLIHLSGNGVRSGGTLRMRGADAIGQGLQNRVMVLAGVRDTDQPSLGRREQQRADGTVDGAVSDVENALGLCGGG